MFSSGSTSANFKGLRRKVSNDVNLPNMPVSRPSTATSTDHSHSNSVADMLEPSLSGPPSPEGIRAFSRRMQRSSMAEQPPSELAPSSGSSSLRSETPETPWEPSLENLSLSKHSSRRSSALLSKDRPESVQLFGKAVFTRKPKMRRGHSDFGNSLLSLTEIPTETVPDVPKEQRFIQSMFTRRRARGVSEASTKKYQISGPYDFQHVSHSSKESLSGSNLGELNRTRTKPITPSALGGYTCQTLDKPLPKPPTHDQELQRPPSRNSIQLSPLLLPRSFPSDVQTSPIPPPPRTSSRISLRHDRNDSVSTVHLERSRANSNTVAPAFILPAADGPSPPSESHVPSDSVQPKMSDNENSPYSTCATNDDVAWPLTNSMTSLTEVPEEDEYHLTTIRSRTSIMSNGTSIRGSVSVPHLRRMSLSQATQRPTSNASDTLGRFDLFAAQRALREHGEDEMDDDDAHENWEDDIDYCYDHEAEADCDFAWERPSCDLQREDYLSDSPMFNHETESSFGSFGPVAGNLLSADVPALSPTSYALGVTQLGAITPTSSTMPITSNFSLPRIDSSTQLKRDYDHDRSHSSASSSQDMQGFCLSPSLLIPNDYHEKILQYERGELISRASNDELKSLQHDAVQFKFDGQGTNLHPRSSASTTVSTLSEQSGTSSRYPSSSFTRWTGSSSSSWQMPIDTKQAITAVVDEEPVAVPASDATLVNAGEPQPTATVNQEPGHSRAQSEAMLLMKVPDNTALASDSEAAKESLKTHRRARTASRSHTNVSPSFALFPQVPQRP
ncbi:hypothetical protein F4808DRAFT_161471 [Astrocystis sublimbata]|nr:hypothetical protein F4808DRAFT_161471 [Astrocystis sublimbata]